MSLNVSQVRPRGVRPSDGIVSIVKLPSNIGGKKNLVNKEASTRSNLIYTVVRSVGKLSGLT